MKLVKPLELSLLHKTFEWEGRPRWVATVLLGFSLDDGEPVLEPDLWTAISDALGSGVIFDECMPKPRGELLASARYFAPGGEAVGNDRVRLKLGNIEKELAVFGDRYWQLGVTTAPEPMREKPLDWAHAFGGKSFKENPVGRGIDAVDVHGEQRVPLPNVEHPRRLVGGPGDRPEPAGFGPLDLTWPQRYAKCGTYDDNWIRNHAPGLAPDLDWEFFNAAQDDQWTKEFFRGDEDFECVNLHPERPTISGKLPALRTRCVIDLGSAGERNLHDVALRIDTVWMLPHLGIGVMVYRGTANIQESDGTDIRNAVLGYERMADAPLDISHYQTVLERRLDPEETLRWAMTTKDMIPPGFTCGFARLIAAAGEEPSAVQENMQAGMAHHIAEAETARTAQIAELEKVIANGGEDAKPVAARLAELLKQPAPVDPRMAALLAEMEAIAPGAASGKLDPARMDLGRIETLKDLIAKFGAEQKGEARDKLNALLAQLGGLEDSAEKTAALKRTQDAVARMDALQPLPRPPGRDQIEMLEDQIRHLARERDRAIENGAKPETLPTPDIDIAGLRKQLDDATVQFRDTYVRGAHLIEGASPHAGKEVERAQKLLEAVAGGKRISGEDFAGVVLAGKDLSGVDFSGCFLEGANFERADLSGANFSGAVLARANLRGANLDSANLQGCSIGAVRAGGATFSNANLKSAILSKGDFENAVFANADLEGADLLEAGLRGAVFENARLPGAIFLELDLEKTVFRGALLNNAMFVKCRAPDADFSEARLFEVNFVELAAPRLLASRARAENVRFVGGATMDGASFVGAFLERASFRDAVLDGADFTGAHIVMADFGGARLRHAVFENANAFRTGFIRADLEKARASNMNVMEGNLMFARLTGTDFTGANLYAVEFMQATLGQTEFRGANLERSKLADWRPS